MELAHAGPPQWNGQSLVPIDLGPTARLLHLPVRRVLFWKTTFRCWGMYGLDGPSYATMFLKPLVQ